MSPPPPHTLVLRTTLIKEVPSATHKALSLIALTSTPTHLVSLMLCSVWQWTATYFTSQHSGTRADGHTIESQLGRLDFNRVYCLQRYVIAIIWLHYYSVIIITIKRSKRTYCYIQPMLNLSATTSKISTVFMFVTADWQCMTHEVQFMLYLNKTFHTPISFDSLVTVIEIVRLPPCCLHSTKKSSQFSELCISCF